MELLWMDFLNSEWHDWRGSGRTQDRLKNSEWLKSFLELWRLSAPIPPTSQDLEKLKMLRSELLIMADRTANGQLLSRGDIPLLNHVLESDAVKRSILSTKDGVKLILTPVHQGWVHVMAEIVSDFIDTIVNREPNRVRICENPDCRWVFYDDTRNRSKHFCSDKLCGNLMKVRRFRLRQKQTE